MTGARRAQTVKRKRVVALKDISGRFEEKESWGNGQASSSRLLACNLKEKKESMVRM